MTFWFFCRADEYVLSNALTSHDVLGTIVGFMFVQFGGKLMPNLRRVPKLVAPPTDKLL